MAKKTRCRVHRGRFQIIGRKGFAQKSCLVVGATDTLKKAKAFVYRENISATIYDQVTGTMYEM
jgi:hypothetical protein